MIKPKDTQFSLAGLAGEGGIPVSGLELASSQQAAAMWPLQESFPSL